MQRDSSFTVDRKWQATLNLVFAIGGVYSHLTLANWRAEKRDYLVYHSRAWALSLKDPWWFSHPDLPHMQITGERISRYFAYRLINSIRSSIILLPQHRSH